MAPYQRSKTPAINDRDGNTSERITTDTHTKRRRKEIKKKATTTLNFFKPNKNKKVEKKKIKGERKKRKRREVYLYHLFHLAPPSLLSLGPRFSLISFASVIFIKSKGEKNGKHLDYSLLCFTVRVFIISIFLLFFFFLFGDLVWISEIGAGFVLDL